MKQYSGIFQTLLPNEYCITCNRNSNIVKQIIKITVDLQWLKHDQRQHIRYIHNILNWYQSRTDKIETRPTIDQQK